MASRPRKILLFPQSNVLGHLTRTLALAEEFDAQGDEVHVVLSRAHGSLKTVLPPGLRILASPEMQLPRTRSDPLASYEDGLAADRANLDRAGALGASEKSRYGRRLRQMIERDTAIIRDVDPDVVIADQRVTPALIRDVGPDRMFHVASVLGYPSFFRRVSGTLPFPLGSGHLLVPGVREIEYWRRPAAPAVDRRRESLCGPFRWEGWRRLNRDAAPPPASDVFLFFGSTGNSGRIMPWLLRHLPERYRVSGIAFRAAGGDARRGAHISARGNLEDFLVRTSVAFCHGGHGTVMECILQRTPMVIFPHNIEQLEIGRQVERMGLGVLVKRPYHQLGGAELGTIVEGLRADGRIAARLEKYSALLRRRNGARRAVAVVHRSLAESGSA
ncbi:MAG TPA: hypothetical protein VMS43_09225 [Allosphingosinicella sp.]|nr:hypothetical protein [Allosphingosinicella sp.]